MLQFHLYTYQWFKGLIIHLVLLYFVLELSQTYNIMYFSKKNQNYRLFKTVSVFYSFLYTNVLNCSSWCRKAACRVLVSDARYKGLVCRFNMKLHYGCSETLIHNCLVMVRPTTGTFNSQDSGQSPEISGNEWCQETGTFYLWWTQEILYKHRCLANQQH